jgi:hypothetical protein
MWRQWFLLCIHNCAWIFWLTNKNIENAKWALKATKYGSSHDYFLHMWPTSRARKFEPNECK